MNLDSEEEGVFTVSCAGGVRAECRLPATQAPLQGEVCYQVTISGLQGGHSGMDINHGRANANQLMGRVLQQASEKLDGLRLADLQGGVFDNVICPLCDAKMAVPADEAKKFEAFLQEFEQVLKNEYAGCDDGLQLTFAPCQLDSALSAADTERISKVMAALPFGVQAMSVDFPGLVQTSINQGIVSMKEDGLRLSLMIRSSINSQREMVLQQVSAIIRLGGGTVEPQSAYPAWQYVRHSPMRERLMDAYRSINGEDGKLFATHGGLECGLFLEKIPGLDAVSFGPELHDVHSARERLSVPSTERVYQLLCEFLKRSK
ncbi:MAG: aminoacyl-histidine dipeptidase [Ruminococcaceae bacterium]|nr:aminoacyl-histidine dipeptidase [Oscillospiraceae bacterium]